MLRRALVISLVLSLPALAADRSARGRGPLSLAGLIAMAAGLGTLGAGLGFHLAHQTDHALYAPYQDEPEGEKDGIVPRALRGINTPTEKEVGSIERHRATRDNCLWVGATLVGVGVVMLALDTFLARAPVQVALVPSSGGGWVGLSARF